MRRRADVWHGPEGSRPVHAVRQSGERGGWRYDVFRRPRRPLECGIPVRSIRARLINAASVGTPLIAVAEQLGISVTHLRDVIAWILLNPEKAAR